MPDLYASITNRIVAALEAGDIPWQFPWKREPGSVIPRNITTGRPYRGINTVLLNLTVSTAGYGRNQCLTFQQARTLNAHVRRGEAGTSIVFFKMMELKDKAGGEAHDPSITTTVPLLRGFTVFNVEQVEDLPAGFSESAAEVTWNPVAEAERLLSQSGAVIRHGGDKAFYRSADDFIQMPLRSAFAKAEAYYNVALHELTHWTGNSARCDRQLKGRQHLAAYAFEELIAEMGAAFLCAHCGIAGELQHAAYISSWLEALRNDKRLVFTAASLAQKAADFILGGQHVQGEPADQPAPVT